jgi:hypothetical protein
MIPPIPPCPTSARDSERDSTHPMDASSRRTFLHSTAAGLGSIALASLLRTEGRASPAASTGTPHFPPRAKRVIFLFMAGGPSHVDLFDPKPELNAREG